MQWKHYDYLYTPVLQPEKLNVKVMTPCTPAITCVLKFIHMTAINLQSLSFEYNFRKLVSEKL